jgi:hypothetical protein
VRKAARDLDLREELTKYRSQVEEQEAGEVEDPVLPQELLECCHRLLDKACAEPDSEGARLARAAVLYFVTLDDADSDALSMVGLEDDLEVVRAVERVIEGGSGLDGGR